MLTYLEFEKPIAALDQRITELRDTANAGEIDIDAEVAKLEAKSAKLLKDTYAKLTPWQKTQVARHPERPHFKHYVAAITDDFMEAPDKTDGVHEVAKSVGEGLDNRSNNRSRRDGIVCAGVQKINGVLVLSPLVTTI